MTHGPSPAGGQVGPARSPGRTTTGQAAGSGVTLRMALAALLVAVVLAGISAAIPHVRWDSGPARHHALPVSIVLEAVLAVLLFAAERHRRRVPAVGQPAAGLRVVVRAGLIGWLIAIPVLFLLNAAHKIAPRPAPRLTPHPLKLHPAGHRLAGGIHFDLALVIYALIALALLAAIVVCVILIRRLSWRGVGAVELDELTDEEAEEQLRQAVRSGQAALHEIDDARLAIIACYVAMEQSLARAGAARGAAETPDELLARVAEAGLVHGGEAARLTELFYEARYSTHPLPAERRDEARQALEVLAAALGRRAEQAAAEAARAAGAPASSGDAR
jgi:Domain of unknown function (DUF4129)